MKPFKVTPGTLLSIVRDPVRRSALFAAMDAESGSPLPLHNAAGEAAENFRYFGRVGGNGRVLLLLEDVRDGPRSTRSPLGRG
jgi:hypothetical protein